MKISKTKLILFHPPLHKQPPHTSIPCHLWLFFFLAFFTLAFTLTRLTSTSTAASTAASTALPPTISAALLHYASATFPNSTDRPPIMTRNELAAISSSLLRPGANLLVFGIGHETALFHALNFRGRTVVLDANEYAAADLEQRLKGIEAYEVQYTTRVSETPALLEEATGPAVADCRPVQNLLYSDCRLALNGLPNHIYDVDWDVIVIDGPKGDSPSDPGRMSAIFTAAVLSRSKKTGGKTDVFVHDYNREVERIGSSEFLCEENLIETVDKLAHFVIEKEPQKHSSKFCRRSKSASSSAFSDQ